MADAQASAAGKVSSALVQQLETIGTRVSFAAGDKVMSEGEAGKGIYLLRSGSVRLSVDSHHGKTVPLRTLEPGSFLGLSSTLSCDHCCYTAEVAEPAEFLFVTAQAAQELLRSRPDLCLQVIQLLGQEMSSLCNERAAVNARAQTVKIKP